RLKVLAIAVSAALTSACGTLWAQYVGFVDPFYVFSVDLSVRFALNTIIGGIGTAMGPFVGSILITSLETSLRATFSNMRGGLVGIYLIIYGCLLIIVVRFIPQGLVGWFGQRLRAVRRYARACRRPQALRRADRRSRSLAARGPRRDCGHHRAQRRRQDHPLQRHLGLLRAGRGAGRPRRARRLAAARA